MKNPDDLIYVERPAVIYELPLAKGVRISYPEQVILKIDYHYFDIGAFCYALRSNAMRRPGKPRKVLLDSFMKQRPR